MSFGINQLIQPKQIKAYLVHSLPDLLAQLLAKLADALLVEGEVELDLTALVVALNIGNVTMLTVALLLISLEVNAPLSR